MSDGWTMKETRLTNNASLTSLRHPPTTSEEIFRSVMDAIEARRENNGGDDVDDGVAIELQPTQREVLRPPSRGLKAAVSNTILMS